LCPTKTGGPRLVFGKYAAKFRGDHLSGQARRRPRWLWPYGGVPGLAAAWPVLAVFAGALSLILLVAYWDTQQILGWRSTAHSSRSPSSSRPG
jgi:hypothetical protein